MTSETILENALRRDRAIVIVALTTLTAVAWAYTVWLASNMAGDGMSMSHSLDMGGMLKPDFRPWSVTDAVVTFVMWTVMMVGMMTPSVTPMILIYARVARQAAIQGKPLAASGFFAGGYLLAWTAFSLAATVSQGLLQWVGFLTPMLRTTNNHLGALVLITAGLYQWTPIKEACLKNCQSPLGFIQRHGGFRQTPLGALSIGFQHGLYCIGCCWALMALLFVGGVMNIRWIAALTVFVLLEKVIPFGRIVPRLSGTALMLWGTWALLTPAP